jgi:Ni,Fe-hydrogenase III large subunit
MMSQDTVSTGVVEPTPSTESAAFQDALRAAIVAARNRGEILCGLFRTRESTWVLATWTGAAKDPVVENGVGRGPFVRPTSYGYWGFWALEQETPRSLWRGSAMRQTVTGRGLHRMPLGPVRADVAESIRYQLTVLGDEIHGVRLYPGYKRRHAAEAMAGSTPEQAVRVAERVTGTSPVAHAWAFSAAVEAALNVEVSPAAEAIRTLLAELERLASHLGDLALLASACGTIAAAADLYRQKEAVLRFNAQLTGHRYLRGMVTPGGVAFPPRVGAVELGRMVSALEREFGQIRRVLDHTNSFLDRLHGAGQIPNDWLTRLDLTGFVAKAAGAAHDLRWDRPYGLYETLCRDQQPCRLNQPDAFGRYFVRADEVQQSLVFLRRLPWPSLGSETALQSRLPHASGTGYGLVEAPRGRLVYRVEVEDGTILGVGLDTASRRNWPAVPPALANHNIMQDFPIVDASFALAVSSLDQ